MISKCSCEIQKNSKNHHFPLNNYLPKQYNFNSPRVKNQENGPFHKSVKHLSENEKSFLFSFGLNTISNKNGLLRDCGATTHIIPDKSKFLSFDNGFKKLPY